MFKKSFLSNGIKQLLVINSIVFILTLFFPPLIPLLAAHTPDSSSFQLYQIITHMFVHGGLAHIFFNMFALWMFGVEIENLWGTKKFLIYYLLCGIGASLANYFINPLFMKMAPNVPTIGASGAVYGVLVAFAYLYPNRYIYIYFMIPVKAKYLIMFYIALEVFYTVTMQNTGIAHLAHLGGAIVGFIYLVITSKSKLTEVFDSIKSQRNKDMSFFSSRQQTGYEPPKDDINVYDAKYEEVKREDMKNRANEEDRRSNEKIDIILDKIAKSGYQNLTEEEKRILFDESKKIR